MILLKKAIVKKLFIFFLTVFLGCSDITRALNDCEAEKKKKRKCEIRNLLACELSGVNNSYRSYGIDICTNPDGFYFLLSGSCQISADCQSTGSSSSSGK